MHAGSTAITAGPVLLATQTATIEEKVMMVDAIANNVERLAIILEHVR